MLFIGMKIQCRWCTSVFDMQCAIQKCGQSYKKLIEVCIIFHTFHAGHADLHDMHEHKK
jgi:hypothetical protein